MVKSYGQLVEEGKLESDDENLVRAIYRMIPGDEESGKAEERWITEHQLIGLAGERWGEADRKRYGIDPQKREEEADRIKYGIEVLRNCGLVTTSSGRSRRVRRIQRRPEGKVRELDLYPALLREIETGWADQAPHDYQEPDRFCQVLDTHAVKGQGRWSAPDITLLGGKTLPFLPGKFLDVVTFEIKPELDLTGVYEALSHRTHATHSYLVCHHPRRRGRPSEADVARITRAATREGIGFIIARQSDDYEEWEELVPAVRSTPEPETLHDFLLYLYTSVDRTALRKLRRWLRQDPYLGSHPEVDFSLLKLSAEKKAWAEEIYMEIPLNGGSVGWKHFEKWIPKENVEEIREHMKEAGFIQVVQGGGMKLPS